MGAKDYSDKSTVFEVVAKGQPFSDVVISIQTPGGRKIKNGKGDLAAHTESLGRGGANVRKKIHITKGGSA